MATEATFLKSTAVSVRVDFSIVDDTDRACVPLRLKPKNAMCCISNYIHLTSDNNGSSTWASTSHRWMGRVGKSKSFNVTIAVDVVAGTEKYCIQIKIQILLGFPHQNWKTNAFGYRWNTWLLNALERFLIEIFIQTNTNAENSPFISVEQSTSKKKRITRKYFVVLKKRRNSTRSSTCTCPRDPKPRAALG